MANSPISRVLGTGVLRTVRQARVTGLFIIAAIVGLGIASPAHVILQGSTAALQQEETYKLAVQAFSENRFSDARTLFETVKGVHAEEAKKYLADMKAYKDAVEEGNGVLTRSAGEIDAKSLDFAIAKYEEALTIKKDGPWQPQQQLDKAKALKASLLQRDEGGTEARDHDLCQKALKAVKARQYKEAELFSCPLANDNPAYSCGADEAVHLCQEMGELAKLNPQPTADVAPDRVAAGDFGKGSAAYEKNDFEGARTWFARVEGSEKTAADDYLQRIARYTASMQQADAAQRESRYTEARAAYAQAATIKPDGPGNPQQQAFLTDLRLGIENFYSGDYVQADQYLETYERESTERRDLLHFYRGACKLGRFYLEGARDKGLRERALDDFRMAKKAGFAAKQQDVSPKILQAYDELSVSP